MGRFINADAVDLLGANGDFASLNLFAYCGNNPVARADSNGHFWNFVVGTVAGAVIGGLVAGITSYAQTGKVDWGSVAINAATGAVSGLVAASGLGMVAQAGVTGLVSGAGNFAEQWHTKGIDNVNYKDVACSAVVGGVTSLVGSGAGKTLAGNFETAGKTLLNRGKDKLLTGLVRQSAGQSHSALMRQGTKYATQGMKLINTYRGLSSVAGSFIGAGISAGYTSVKSGLLGW